MGISDLTYSLMIMSRSHEESAIKSRRLSEAWTGKTTEDWRKALNPTATRLVPHGGKENRYG